jgi:hypothetical protein
MNAEEPEYEKLLEELDALEGRAGVELIQALDAYCAARVRREAPCVLAGLRHALLTHVLDYPCE